MDKYIDMLTSTTPEMGALYLLVVPMVVFLAIGGIKVALMAMKEMMGK